MLHRRTVAGSGRRCALVDDRGCDDRRAVDGALARRPGRRSKSPRRKRSRCLFQRTPKKRRRCKKVPALAFTVSVVPLTAATVAADATGSPLRPESASSGLCIRVLDAIMRATGLAHSLRNTIADGCRHDGWCQKRFLPPSPCRRPRCRKPRMLRRFFITVALDASTV